VRVWVGGWGGGDRGGVCVSAYFMATYHVNHFFIVGCGFTLNP